MILLAIQFFLKSLVYSFRRRLPLYADDRSKIFTSYAQSLLDLSVAPGVPSFIRRKLWDRYANHFTMLVSVQRFFVRVVQPDHIRPKFENWVRGKSPSIFLNCLLGYQKTYAGFRPMTDDEREQLSCAAVFIQSENDPDPVTTNILQAIKTLTVVYAVPQQKLYAEKLLSRGVPGMQNRVYTCLAETYTEPYSMGQCLASQYADEVGAGIAKALSGDEHFAWIFPKDIQSEIALLISDLCYSEARTFQGFRAWLADLDKDTPVILTTWDIDFTAELSKLRVPVIYQDKIYDPTVAKIHNKSEQFEALVVGDFHQKAWDEKISRIDRALLRCLTKAEALRHQNEVYVLCNRHSRSYDGAVARIETALAEKYALRALDSGPPKGRGAVLGAARHDLYSTLRAWSFRGQDKFKGPIEQFLNEAMANLNDQGLCVEACLGNRVKTVIENNFGMLVAHGRLFHVFSNLIERRTNSSILQAVLIPGRDSTVRVLSRALQVLGVPTTDVQVLFVSEMPRYKAPIADKLAVIDSHAKAHFCEKYGYRAEDIYLMGSINLEAEVELAKACNSKEIYSKYFKTSEGAVVTYALQPLPIEDIRQALEWCAQAIQILKGVHLIVKLHPAQSDDILNLCKKILSESTGDAPGLRWTVLQNVPFHEVLSVSDILLTHYSNVALAAAVLGKPVATLPVSGVRPKPSLADMHLSQDVISVSDLVSFVKNSVLASEKPRSLYLKENPHMAEQCSLQVLEGILDHHAASS